MSKKYYRVEEQWYGGSTFDSILTSTNGRLKLVMREYPVKRETPCGVWIDLKYGDEKFILNEARKKWACPTQEDALESFKARKYRQIKILAKQLSRAKQAYAQSLSEEPVEVEKEFYVLG